MRAKKYGHKPSGYPGVVWHEGQQQWKANICLWNTYYHVGYFNTPEEAYAAKEARIQELRSDREYMKAKAGKPIYAWHTPEWKAKHGKKS